MTMSYVTDDEQTMLMIQGIDRNPPPIIARASESFFSVARHYGGCTIEGKLYTYFPATDELIRDDVLRAVTKMRKDAAKVARDAAKAKQRELT